MPLDTPHLCTVAFTVFTLYSCLAWFGSRKNKDSELPSVKSNHLEKKSDTRLTASIFVSITTSA